MIGRENVTRTSFRRQRSINWKIISLPPESAEFAVLFRLVANGAPEEIRTPDPQIRSLVLYPAELRARFSPGIRGLRAGWIRDRPGNVAKERFSYPLRPRLASLMALDIAGRLTANSAGIIGVFRGARPTSPNDENASYFTPAPARYGR
jgi:hypothetical protein